ncbi:MAG: competence/damage-inducible protein A [Proteobacteria bacterium]|nr:competence/damage-inducible protein A [Pseudomonadota bacterium]
MTGDRVTAAILIIGDEILSGRTQDTNTQTLARFLGVRGIEVIEVRIVPDETDRIAEAVNTLRAKADYLFTTGGIGPTHDDITADAVAEAFGTPLPENPEAVALLLGRYPGVELNAARRRMARIPEGASLIANPVSIAPGFQIGNVFVLAGVPAIMTGMLDDVAPRLRGGQPVVSRTVRVSGVGEGDIAQPLAAAARTHRDLSLGSYPFFDPAAGRYGSNLVVRGRDAAQVEAVVEELIRALGEAGVTGITRPE